MRKEYDLIISLGGNCAAAAQLRMRGLRPYSLPFDWLYMESPETIEWLAHGFKSGFSDFCLKENLVQIKRGAPVDGGTAPYKYLDSVSGYAFIHHFHRPIEARDGHEPVYSTLSRRLARLDEKLKAASKVLFILATNFTYDLALIESLSNAIRRRYPHGDFAFKIMQFNAKFADARTSEQGQTLFCAWSRYARMINGYDFSLTSSEWSFLDDIALKAHPLRPLKGFDKIRYKLWKSISKHFLKTGAALKDMNFRHVVEAHGGDHA